MSLAPEDYMEPGCCLKHGKCSCHHGNGTEEKCAAPIPVAEIIAKCDELFNMEKSKELGEHLRFWRKEAQRAGDKKGEVTILSEMMGHYRMIRDPERGIEAVESGIALLKTLDLSDTLSAGTVFLNAATALQSFGKVDEALPLYAETARIYERNLDPADWRFAGLYNNMAAAYCEKGEFKLAETCYLRAIDVLKACGNFNDSAVTCLNLAQLYRQWNGDEAMVETMAACAMEYFNAPECPRDGYYAHSCTKCASGFEALGYGEIARELLSRAGEYYERT
jgi:tetratricopeptide (TPR) repeat protein